jgi:acyl transferase domain-containing protein/acyl carrier protein
MSVLLDGVPHSPGSEGETMYDVAESMHESDVAIVGIACRFPGCSSAEAFWDAVRNGRECLRELDREEMSRDGVPESSLANPGYIARGGPLEEIDKIDAAFFGLSPREADRMDPQHRLMLELAWEALEDAGIPPRSPLVTGVFAGCSNPNYLLFNVAERNPSWFGSADYVESIIASDRDYLATRVSYKLGLCGPSVSVQTACSTSLVAVHMACQSLLLGECDVALAGGVALQVPHRSGYLWQAGGYSSRDGHCRPFGADADGTVFGSGGGLVVLRRLEDALAARDRVIAVVKGSAIGNDGSHKASFAAPSVAGQARVIRAAHAAAGVAGSKIGYVEAHGTGTPLGDPIEVAALNAAFSNCGGNVGLGSVKGNIGHLDTAAGIAGLIKTALSLQAGELLPSLYCEHPNPAIDFAGGPFFVNVRRRPWPKRAPYAGVSSFGIGGTNAHVVLGPAPAETVVAAPAPAPGHASGATLLAISARDGTALRALAQRYVCWLEDAREPAAQIAAAAAQRRSMHRHRLAVVGADARTLAQGLEDWLAGAPPGRSSVRAGEAEAGSGSDLVWVFGGQGGAWPGMGRELLEYEAFAAAVDRIDAVTRGAFAWPVRALLAGEAPSDALKHPWSSQMAQFAMQAGLAELWRALGLRPAAVVGQSVGEIAAAVTAGILTLEDAARLAAARTATIVEYAHGQMAWVGLDGDTLSTLLSDLAPAAVQAGEVWVAVYSGPESSVLGGSAAALDRVLGELTARAITWRAVETAGLATHSPAASKAAEVLERELAGLRWSRPGVAMLSTVAGYVETDIAAWDARYWADNLRRPVRFGDAIAALLAQGHRRFLEIGPRPTSGAAIDEVARACDVTAHALASCEREAARSTFLDSLARLQVAGFDPDWSVVHPANPPHLRLPAYPWQKTRHWIEDRPRGTAASVIGASAGTEHGSRLGRLLERCIASSLDDRTWFWEGSFDPAANPIWREHMLAGLVIMPAAAILDMVLSAAAAALTEPVHELSEVAFFDAITALPDSSVALQLAIFHDTHGYTFKLSRAAGNVHETRRGWQPCAEGRILTSTSSQSCALDAADTFELERIVEGDECYTTMANRGIVYGPRFRLIERVAVQTDRLVAQVAFPTQADSGAPPHAFQLLDAAFQSLWADEIDDVGGPRVPIRVARLRLIRGAQPLAALAEVQATRSRGSDARDIRILEGGEPVLEISGIEARQFDEELQDGRWLSEPVWRKVTPTAALQPTSSHPTWVVVAGGCDLCHQFETFLRERGDLCHVIESLCGSNGSSAAADADWWHERLAPILRSIHGPWRIVLLDSLSNPATEENLISIARSDCLSIAGLLRCLSDARPAIGPELVTVTCGAADAEPLDMQAGVTRAPLWGFLKTLAVEHPELMPRCVDIDADTPPALLWESIVGYPQEPELAIRSGSILTLRLSPVAGGTTPGNVTLDGTSSYLIVGATGELGLPVLSWLVARGARHLVLAARSAPKADLVAQLKDISRDGVEIDFRRLDVADAAAVVSLIGEIGRTPHQLNGVFHLAGVVKDGFAEALNEDDLASVLAAKALGAWHLHEATRATPLDVFGMFSSTAALLGAPGQAAHGAANAVLDLLARIRRAQGLPACTINWGPWMSAADDGERTAQHRDMGFEPIAPERGIRLLETALRDGNSRYCVFRFDATRWLARYPTLAPPPMLAESVPTLSPSGPPPTPRAGIAGRVRRERPCETVIREELAAVLGMAPDAIDPERPFAEQNLTSMMALELRSRLEAGLDIAIPTTAIWRHPTVTRLAAALKVDVARKAALETPSLPVELRYDPAAE